MAHLVDILFSEKINPILIKKTAGEKGLELIFVTKILNDPTYEIIYECHCLLA